MAGVAALWPAARHARTHFLASAGAARGGVSPGDHLQSVYRLWLVGHQLEHGRAPWRDPYSFRPEAKPQVNFAGWPFGLVFWPLAAAFGATAGWNAFVLLTYVAAGGLACAWLRELGVARPGALVGGLAFAVAPYRVAQSTGHMLGPVSVLLPLALWAWERERGRSRGPAWSFLAAAALASIPLSGQVHLALGAIPFFGVYVLVRARERRAVVAAALALASAVAAGIAVWRLSIAGSLESSGRSLHEVRHYSATWLDFVRRDGRAGSERYAFLGWLTPVLALVGFVALVRARRAGLAALLAAGALVPVLLALGTHLPLYAFLWHHLPPLRYPRVPERLLPVALLCLAALAGVAVAAYAKTATLAAVLVLAVAVDLHVSRYSALAADEANAAYAALRRAPPGRVLELPVFRPGTDLGSVYQYYELQAARERPGGYSTLAPRSADRVARALRPLNCGRWGEARGRLLDRLGVRYLVVDTSLYGTGRWPGRCLGRARRALGRQRLRRLGSDGTVTIYERL